jgi:hypothetical protein
MNKSEAGKLGALKSQATNLAKLEERISIYNSNPRKCLYCETPIPYNKRINKFCNHTCAAIHNNKLFPKRHATFKHVNQHSSQYIPKEYGNCLWCNNKLKGHQIKYCCHECHRNYKWEKKKQEIEAGECTDNNRSTVKKYILELHGRKCSICHLTTWQGQPIPLVLDHIDGNSDNGKINNLRLVCGNCDMLLPTYKSKNRGNGRAWRRQKYAEGKSY